jgi:hypothetical protein
MWQFAIPALAQGGAAIASYLSKRNAIRNSPRLENTAYGKELQRQASEGRYSPSAISEMTGKVSRQAGNQANYQSVRTKGNLISRGMGNSIAGQRLLSEPYTAAAETVSDYRGGLETANEASKVSAREKYGQLKYQEQQNRAMAMGDAKAGLWGGLGSAVASGVGSYLSQRQAGLPGIQDKRGIFQGVMDSYREHGDPAMLYNDLLNMGRTPEEAKAIMAQLANQ